MSVVLENDRLVISIKTGSPEEEIVNLQKNLLRLLSDQREDANHDNYWVLWLLQEMMPDKNSFQNASTGNKFDITAIKEVLFSYYPGQILESLLKAQTYLWKYATIQEGRSVEIEDIVGDLSCLAKAVEEGFKQQKVAIS
ncbi:hypothetical protein Q0590_08390 [Rhodocytophaga aerolata]|uniref:Uncharacterized protein n=1 Tax=Rhodocytophaga aerolata TaxID=455078 RepID=A0ABT8R2E7_9BACT|nr:hypothetical protein [Rhodocytophaga aerolata]MDO1446267.1 hypothetical protein [Rhodocytophaga aerolata]